MAYICSTKIKGIKLKNITDMIEKGSKEYKMAQKIANDLQMYAGFTKRNSFMFECGFEYVGRMIDAIKKLDCFAAKVAETIEKTMTCFGFQVAKISSKQAWVLACAAVENGIKGIYDEEEEQEQEEETEEAAVEAVTAEEPANDDNKEFKEVAESVKTNVSEKEVSNGFLQRINTGICDLLCVKQEKDIGYI